MMATIQEIRVAVAAACATIPGLRTSATVPGQVNAPEAVVTRTITTYATDFNDSTRYLLAVTVYVAASNDRTAQDTIDAYLSPDGTSSITAAIHADPTLGGVVSYARVIEAGRDALTEYAGIEYLAATWTVEVVS